MNAETRKTTSLFAVILSAALLAAACEPVAKIDLPAQDITSSDDAFYYDGYDEELGLWYKDVHLVGGAIDEEDGQLEGDQLVWTTDRDDLQDPELARGCCNWVRLYSDACFGTRHTITLTVTDSDGEVDTATREIRIWSLC